MSATHLHTRTSVEAFFELFLEELRQHPALRTYYKFLESPGQLPFRKAYFCQRLQYVLDKVDAHAWQHPGRALRIWDCGCGYATTQIFLALNGYASRGSTLEFYFKEIPRRLEYWSRHGDMGLLKVDYEDIFENPPPADSLDVIIVQDTLHHLEPLADSLRIFQQALLPGGTLIAIEENGNNIVQTLKLYRQRGNRRIITYYDEGLGREVTMGNENIRPWKVWKREFEKAGLEPDPASLQFIRLFPPVWYRLQTEQATAQLEQWLWRAVPLLREYFFFGINFVVRKPGPEISSAGAPAV
ncbi:MAG: hypothetical protein KatS3mg030_614 [Saprospiraceae bacterium]|nr:MAG: hypothetical protein KatS3mg030_614 [Saprospiraceae bacterium]